jgi:hypothetical protein
VWKAIDLKPTLEALNRDIIRIRTNWKVCLLPSDGNIGIYDRRAPKISLTVLWAHSPPSLVHIPLTTAYNNTSFRNIRYPDGTSQRGPLVEIIAFQGPSYWSDFMVWLSFQGVMIDVHGYQVAMLNNLAMSWDQHISTVCSKKEQYTSFHLWTVVGE